MWPHRWQPTRLLHPWDFPGKSTGVGCRCLLLISSLVPQLVRNLPTMQAILVWPLGWENFLEKGTATHSSILAWRIPWTEEIGGLQSTHGQSWTQLRNFHSLISKYFMVLYHLAAVAAAAKSLQPGLTLCDPMDCSLPGSYIHGIFRARVLELGAIAFLDSIILLIPNSKPGH